MITLTVKSKGPSNPKAIEIAKKLLESKKQMQEESKEFAKTPEFQEIKKRLQDRNGRK
jgi:hypothetical protein